LFPSARAADAEQPGCREYVKRESRADANSRVTKAPFRVAL
jgi:hypothetical protein